jgi:Mg-chelatase subunit ChlD
MMPPGEKITDATDKKWLKDMELRRFRLDQLDVGFAIDSTGSMGQIIQWIQRDVIKMLRAFQLLSREPRIGVTLYRDIGDKYVVFNVPLTDDTRMLEAALKTADAKGGGDVPEALYDGLHSLLMQKWSGGKSSRKVIMVIGDAPRHEKMQNSLEEMVSNYAKKGFVFFAVKVRTMYASTQDLKNWDPELKSLDTLAEKGGGQSVWIDFGEQALAASGVNTADPSDKETPDRLLFRQVLTAAMEKGYEDRLDPFLNVLMEYVEEPLKEKLVAFPPKPPDTKGDGPHVKKPPVKKFDPQQR